jgi:hypothetical protein
VTVDDHGSHGSGRRPADDQDGDERPRETDQDYFWSGKPGEDFGPLPPPEPLPTGNQRRPGPARELGDRAGELDVTFTRSTARRPASAKLLIPLSGPFSASVSRLTDESGCP